MQYNSNREEIKLDQVKLRAEKGPVRVINEAANSNNFKKEDLLQGACPKQYLQQGLLRLHKWCHIIKKKMPRNTSSCLIAWH